MLDFNKLKCDSKEKAKKVLENGYNQEAFVIYSLIKLMESGKYSNDIEEKTTFIDMSEVKRTPKIDGDTEFENIIMKISNEKFSGVISIMADFAETIKIMNNKAYELMIMKLKELI
ncbi:MAG: hypothetical protein RRY22_04980 [Bacilli bacterium]